MGLRLGFMAPTGSVIYKVLDREVAPLNPEPQTRRKIWGCFDGPCKHGDHWEYSSSKGDLTRKGTQPYGQFWGNAF